MAVPRKATGKTPRGVAPRVSRVGSYPEATTQKVSVTLSRESVEWGHEVAQREGRSFSAVIADAVDDVRRSRLMREWLEESERKHGPIPKEVQDEVDAELRAAGVIK